MKKIKSFFEYGPILGSAVLFGCSYMAVKTGVSDVSTFTLLMWRFLFAFAALNLCVLFKVGKIRLRGKDLKPLLLIALFQPLMYFICATYGIGMTTVSESGTIAALMPIVSIIFSAIILKEKPTKFQTAGIFISVTGVIIVGLVKGQSPSFNILGYILLIAAMSSDAIHVVFVRKSTEYTEFEKTYVMALVGFVTFTICAFVEHSISGTVTELVTLPFRNLKFLGCVLYLSIGCQVLAFQLSNVAYVRMGVAKGASFSGLVTVISVLTGVFIMGDDFTFMQGVGTAMVIVGIYISNALLSKKEKTIAES